MTWSNLRRLAFIIFLGLSSIKSFIAEDNIYDLDQKPHKVRHQRHLYNFKTPVNSVEYNRKCIVKLWDDVSFPQEECSAKRCAKHDDCWEEYGASKLCICDPHLCGLVCIDYSDRCKLPPKPANGRYFVSDLRVGDQIEYSCDPGFAVKGPRKRFCQANLKLSGKDPECTDQTDRCFSPPYIPNTQVLNGQNRDDYRNKESVTLTCQKGFEDKRNSFINATCEGNVWRHNQLNCERISCGKLEDPLNGRTMYISNYTFQSVAIQFCNDGFVIVCSVINQLLEKDCKRICDADRKWTGMTAICKPILCPELKSPDNGMVMGHWNTVNSIKNFKCNEGYQLVGSYLRKCQHNGEWDGTDAICNVRDCGPPPQIPFATVNFKSTTHGAEALYICEYGTTMFGESSTLRCGEAAGQSAWIPKPVPQCMRHCPAIEVKHASVMAEDKLSKSIFPLATMLKHGVHIKVLCDHGFELNRQEMPVCNNGSLSYIPKCVEASCRSRPASIKFSTVRFYDLRHNAVARYYCHTGYRMKKEVNNAVEWITSYDIKCMMGNWTNVIPGGCQPTLCSNPIPPENGDIFLQGQLDRTRIINTPMRLEHNRMVKYECNPDYRLVGPKIAICLNGRWSPHETPKCEYIMHDELPLAWLFYPSANKK